MKKKPTVTWTKEFILSVANTKDMKNQLIRYMVGMIRHLSELGGDVTSQITRILQVDGVKGLDGIDPFEWTNAHLGLFLALQSMSGPFLRDADVQLHNLYVEHRIKLSNDLSLCLASL